jgi:hypothetical protein
VPRRLASFLAFSLLLAGVGSTQARAVGFDCITNNSAGDCSIAEAQLSVTLSSPGATQVRFDLVNATGGAASAIAGIYFDDSGLLASIASIVNGAGTSFAENGAPPGLPGGTEASPPFDEDFRLNATPPPSSNGVDPGETVGVIFDLVTGMTVAQAQAAFASGALRVGVHVISFASGGSESLVNVPEPSPMLLMGLGLVGLAIAGRRRPPSG